MCRMNKSRLYILLLVGLVLGITSYRASALELRTLALNRAALPELYIAGEDGYVKLVFNPVRPFDVYKARAESPLSIFRQVTEEDGKSSYEVVSKVEVPDGSPRILLLGWLSGDEPRFSAVPDNFETAGFDDWMLINTTGKQIEFQPAAKTGDDPFLVEPQSIEKIKPSVTRNTGTGVRAFAIEGGKKKRFYSTYWPVYPDSRFIVVFYEDGSRVRLMKISDVLRSALKKDPGDEGK